MKERQTDEEKKEEGLRAAEKKGNLKLGLLLKKITQSLIQLLARESQTKRKLEMKIVKKKRWEKWIEDKMERKCVWRKEREQEECKQLIWEVEKMERREQKKMLEER